jgi:hypothetical protein
MTWFWQSFFPNAAATFLGVVLAVLFAHYYERWRDRRRNREREAVLMNQLRHALGQNTEVLKFLIKSSSPQHIVTQRLDTSLMDVIIAGITPVFHVDYEFMNDVAALRYDFNELNRRLDFQVHVLIGPLRAAHLQNTTGLGTSFAPFEQFSRDYSKEAVITLAQKLLEKTGRAVAWIDRRLKN